MLRHELGLSEGTCGAQKRDRALGLGRPLLSREELAVILESFSSFEENPELEWMEKIKWGDALIRRFNGRGEAEVMGYFEKID